MSNIDFKKRKINEKRVSFDRDWLDHSNNENNQGQQSVGGSGYGRTNRDIRIRSLPNDSHSLNSSRLSKLSESDSCISESGSNRRQQTPRTNTCNDASSRRQKTPNSRSSSESCASLTNSKHKILRNAKSDADLVVKDSNVKFDVKSQWNFLGRRISKGELGRRKSGWDELHNKLQFVGVLRQAMTKEAITETRKQKLAQQKKDTAKARLRLFRMAGKMTVYCIRLMKMHSLRNRENDDEVSPFIKGLHFRDYDAQIELMFDPSKFKANKSMRLSEEIKRILHKESKDRTPQDIYSAQIALRNIKSISDYPARMQRKIAERGIYERYEAKRIIVRQGHPPSAFYFILSGDVVVMKMDESNTYARPVLHLARGDSFGELGIIQGTRRKATIICREATELLSISKKDYHDIFMLGGVKSIGDPDQDQFLRGLSFLRGWPIDLLKENQSKMMFHFYKRDDVIAKDTHYFDWIIIVKSGSIRILKKLKKVTPFEWKNKDKTEFVSEKQKREVAELKDSNRRMALSELKIPTRNVEIEDEIFEEYPGKFKVFEHPVHANEIIDQLNKLSESSDVPSTRSSLSLPDILLEDKNKRKSRSSFQNIQTFYLPSVSEISDDSEDYTKITKQNKKDAGTGKLLFDKDSRRKESIMELENEMIGFQEEKLTYRDDIDTGIKRKDPENITEADLKPEFVNIQTLTKGQVFGLPELILDPQPNFCVVSNGADCILIDKQFYMEHADDHLKNRMRQELCPYPSEEEMQTRLQSTVDWHAYRSGIMTKTIKTIKPKRPVTEAVVV